MGPITLNLRDYDFDEDLRHRVHALGKLDLCGITKLLITFQWLDISGLLIQIFSQTS